MLNGPEQDLNMTDAAFLVSFQNLVALYHAFDIVQQTIRRRLTMQTGDLPSKRRVRQGFENMKLDGASRPEKGLYAHHIGFTMRTLSENIPPKGIRVLSPDPDAPLPRAFH